MSDSKWRIQSSGLRVKSVGFRESGSEFSFEFRVQGLGFRVSGSEFSRGFRVQGEKHWKRRTPGCRV